MPQAVFLEYFDCSICVPFADGRNAFGFVIFIEKATEFEPAAVYVNALEACKVIVDLQYVSKE